MTGLPTALTQVEPVYEIPDDDLIGEVLVPALAHASEVWIASGYFSSRCLAQVAPGLAAFITQSEAPLKLLISPEISPDDRDAIEKGVTTRQEWVDRVAAELFGNSGFSESALVQHTRECFAYLIAVQRLELRFVLMDTGMYHKKQWLVGDGDTFVAIHGSGNATSRGLLVNGEQMTVDRAWCDGPAAKRRVEKLVEQWVRQWENEHGRSLTLQASEGLRFAGRGSRAGRAPTVDDFWEAWRRDHAAGLEPELPKGARPSQEKLLEVPAGLEWRTGQYRHQGVAVDAFLRAEGRGVLAIATGAGKTRTALIASVEAQHRNPGPMLVIVLVPSRPLMLQWRDDIRDFGIEPVLPGTVGPVGRRRRLQEIEVALSVDSPRTEVMIVTNALFARDEAIQELLDRLPEQVQVIFIGDEMHNLGAPTVFASLPQRADLRLGLSATPIRQYDPDGTDRLFEYFGQTAYEFDLGDAIRAGCLTPYEYYLHPVTLSAEEVDKWMELTEELRRAGFKFDDDGQSVTPSEKAQRLLRDRRAVIEQAAAKVGRLRTLFEEMGPPSIQRCLVYPESTDRSLRGRAAGLPESSAGASAFAGRCRSEEPSLSVAQRGSGALRAPARGCARRARACWREPRSRAGAVSGRQAGSGSARNRTRAAAHWPAQGQRFARCRVQRRAEWVSRPARAK